LSDVINKTTFERRFSVHTPDYDPKEWWNTFNNPHPKLPQGFDFNPRNWKTIENKIVATTEEEKAIWDKEHPISEPEPSVEERLTTVESELDVVKSDVANLKTASKTEEPTK
jgi:hypothetical protein